MAVQPDPDPGAGMFRFRLYGRGAMELSSFLPILESFGLTVVEAVPHLIQTPDGGQGPPPRRLRAAGPRPVARSTPRSTGDRLVAARRGRLAGRGRGGLAQPPGRRRPARLARRGGAAGLPPLPAPGRDDVERPPAGRPAGRVPGRGGGPAGLLRGPVRPGAARTTTTTAAATTTRSPARAAVLDGPGVGRAAGAGPGAPRPTWAWSTPPCGPATRPARPRGIACRPWP